MRKIKFRFWDNVQKKMFNEVTLLGLHWECEEDPSVYIGGKHFNYGDNGKTVPDYSDGAVMQFTGMQDNNGKEVYEGDIVKGKRYSAQEKFVRFIGEIAYFRVSFVVNGVGKYEGIYGEELHGNYEVIGNIYENPEFLKDFESTELTQAEREV